MGQRFSRLLMCVGCAMGIFPLSSPRLFAQGNLTPPGPPAPTFKALDQIEPRTPISSLPFTITNSGAYYVTTNLVGNIFGGIQVNANDVFIDLNGFTLTGGSGDGIVAQTTRTNVVVR